MSRLSEPEYERIRQLFERLDVDKNGSVSIRELARVIKQDGDKEEHARRLISKGSTDGRVDSISFADFVNFVQTTERQLRTAFDQLDHDRDRKVNAWEMRKVMAELGVKMSRNQAEKLLAQMDRDGSMTIELNEWVDYLLFSGATQLKDIFGYLRKGYAFDIGEGSLLPDDFSEEERESGEAWKTLVSGGVAGCVSRTMTAPLDRMKTLWQAFGASASRAGIVQFLSIMKQESGPASFWFGNGVNCLKVPPESAIRFETYELYKKMLFLRNADERRADEVTLGEKFLAGAAAGATAQTVIFPLEVFKTRMCLRKRGQYASLLDCARQLYAEAGWRAFYRGYQLNMMIILPYAGIDLALYETFKNAYLERTARGAGNSSVSKPVALAPPPVYVSLSAGALSSVCGQLATYPLSLAKVRYQTMQPNERPAMLTLFRSIVREEGTMGLYRGLVPNMLKVLPAVSISYATFEQMRGLFGIRPY